MRIMCHHLPSLSATRVRRFVNPAALAALLILSACAPKGAGPMASIIVKSKPSGANVRFSTGERCTTPCTMNKRKANNFKVTISKDGYKPKTVLVKKFVAGFSGDGADTTGATINKVWSGLVRYTPNPIFVKLEPSWTRR